MAAQLETLLHVAMRVHEFVAVQLTRSGSQLEAAAVNLTCFVAHRKVGIWWSFNRLLYRSYRTGPFMVRPSRTFSCSFEG